MGGRLAEWERTGDTRWRDKIVNGLETIGAQQRRWFAGNAVYDPSTGRFTDAGDKLVISHLNGMFGIVEISSELLTLVNAPAYRKAWLEYCRYYNAPKAEIVALLGKDLGGRAMTDTNSRMTAYAAVQERDRALALRAWREFFTADVFKPGSARATRRTVAGTAVLRPLQEQPGISTNGSAQWGLAALQHLALIGDTLDEAAQAAGLLQ